MYEDERYETQYRSDSGSAGRGEIVTFPASVQNRLDQAQRLLRQDRAGEAMTVLQQTGAELARTSPEHLMLAALAQMGVRSVTFEETTMDTSTVTTDRYAFGIRYGQHVQTTVNAKTRRRRIYID